MSTEFNLADIAPYLAVIENGINACGIGAVSAEAAGSDPNALDNFIAKHDPACDAQQSSIGLQNEMKFDS